MHPFLQTLEALRERPPTYREFSKFAEQKQFKELGINLVLSQLYHLVGDASVVRKPERLLEETAQAAKLIVCAYAFIIYPERTHEGPINEAMALHTHMAARALVQLLLDMDSAEDRMTQALGMLEDPAPGTHHNELLDACRRRSALCFKLFKNAMVAWRRADLPHTICRLEEENAAQGLRDQYWKWLCEGVGSQDRAVELLREARYFRRVVQVSRHAESVKRLPSP